MVKERQDITDRIVGVKPVSMVISKGRLRWFARVECKHDTY